MSATRAVDIGDIVGMLQHASGEEKARIRQTIKIHREDLLEDFVRAVRAHSSDKVTLDLKTALSTFHPSAPASSKPNSPKILPKRGEGPRNLQSV